MEILGSGTDWMPKSPVTSTSPYQAFNPDNDSSNRTTSGSDNIEPLISTLKLQQLSVHEDQPVIIPDHLQVPEADRSHLNFGSFGEDFDDNANYADEDEDDKKSVSSVEENLPEEAPVEQIKSARFANTLWAF